MRVSKTIFNIISFVFLCVGVVLGILAIVLLNDSNNKLDTYKQCTGVITDFVERESIDYGDEKRNRVNIFPMVEYTVDGETYEFVANFYSSSMTTGQEIEVLYNEEDPTKHIIKSGLYLAPIVLGCISAVFIIIAIILSIVKKKAARFMSGVFSTRSILNE